MLDEEKEKSNVNLGFILKKSVMEASSSLTDEEFRELICGLFNYATKGVEPELNSKLAKIIFKMEKPSIDRNNEKWRMRSIIYNKKKNEESYVG